MLTREEFAEKVGQGRNWLKKCGKKLAEKAKKREKLAKKSVEEREIG